MILNWNEISFSGSNKSATSTLRDGGHLHNRRRQALFLYQASGARVINGA